MNRTNSAIIPNTKTGKKIWYLSLRSFASCSLYSSICLLSWASTALKQWNMTTMKKGTRNKMSLVYKEESLYLICGYQRNFKTVSASSVSYNDYLSAFTWNCWQCLPVNIHTLTCQYSLAANSGTVFKAESRLHFNWHFQYSYFCRYDRPYPLIIHPAGLVG